jgi:hypothetical protein
MTVPTQLELPGAVLTAEEDVPVHRHLRITWGRAAGTRRRLEEVLREKGAALVILTETLLDKDVQPTEDVGAARLLRIRARGWSGRSVPPCGR